MARQHLLLVDGVPESLRLTEMSLRNAGFSVTAVSNGREALEKCEISLPDLVISETRMPELDGFELCRCLREDERFRAIPFVFLTVEKSVEDKVRGLELGVEDYLTKPIYIREIVTRVRMLLQRRERERLERREGRAGFTGSLGELAMVDLVQTLELGRKAGTMRADGPEGKRATLWFRDGQIVDCETGNLLGESAFFRVLHWTDGSFAVQFGPVEREERITLTTPALLLEGMRRLDEWNRLVERMPPLDRVLEVHGEALSQRLAEIPDEVNSTLRLFDGRRTLKQVIEDSGQDDLSAAATISRLHSEGILREAEPRPEASAPGTSPPGPTPEPAGVDWFAGPLDANGIPIPAILDAPAGAPQPDEPERSEEVAPAPPRTEEAVAPSPPPPPASPPTAAEPDRRKVVLAAEARELKQGKGLRPSRGTLALWILVLAMVAGVAAGIGVKRRHMRALLAEPSAAAQTTVAAAAEAPPPAAADPPKVLAPPAEAAPASRIEKEAPAGVPPSDGPAAAGTGRPAAEPESADVAYRRALGVADEKYRSGAFLAAAGDYRRALAIEETSEALAGLGRALYDGRRPGEALEALQRAVDLDPSNAAAWLALGEVHLARGERADARSAYRRYLEVAPDGENAGEVRQVLQRLR